MRLHTLASTLLLSLAALPANAEAFRPAAANAHFVSRADGGSIHHILVDGEVPQGAAMREPMIADDHFRHFGGGQTQSDLSLPAGAHTLQLILGDQNHIPHDPALVSDKITVTVK